MAKSNLFKTDIAFKKLATGKVHTRPDFSEFNEIYGSWLAETILPSRAAYAVRELPGGAKVEIVAEAFLGCGKK